MDELSISEMQIDECTNSKFVVTQRVAFKHKGVERTYDYIKAHDGVAILVYNTTSKYFPLVKQFRPATYMCMQRRAENNTRTATGDLKPVVPFERGVSYELCAGIVDANRALAEIARCELMEEMGYDVPLEKINFVHDFYSLERAGARTSVFYAEVTDAIRVAEGGGNREQGEFIDIYNLPLAEARTFMYDNRFPKPCGLISAFGWFFMNKTEHSS